jgi:two-component system LytT family response regulator
MIKAFIIDDDSNLRLGLVAMLENVAPNISIIGQAGSLSDGLNLLKSQTADVLFLDIQLTDGTGFDLLEQYQKTHGKPTFKVVFITAHEQYAIRAFHFSALDFLLKPVDLDELKQVTEKLKPNQTTDLAYQNIEVLLEHISKKNDQPKRIALSTAEGIHLVDIKDIIRCESENNYTTFHLNQGKPMIISKTLKEYDDLLSPLGFERIHQSHLINLSFLKSYIKKDGGYVVMQDGKELLISSRKKDRLQQIINNL